MATDSKVKKNLKRIITILVLGIMALFIFNIFINFYQGHQKLERLNQRMEKLNKDIAELNEETEVLKKRIKYVNSKQAIEEIARKDLGLVKEDELLYVIVEEE